MFALTNGWEWRTITPLLARMENIVRWDGFLISLEASNLTTHRAKHRRSPSYFRRQESRPAALLDEKGKLVVDPLGIAEGTMETGQGGVWWRRRDDGAEPWEVVSGEPGCPQQSCQEVDKHLRAANASLGLLVEEEESEDELLDRFGRLRMLKGSFQRDLSSTDQKVESARKVSSPLKKKRRKRR